MRVKLTKKTGLKLEAMFVQDGAIKRDLVIWKIGNRIALLFQYGSSETYVVTVKQSKLELTPLIQTKDEAIIKEHIQNLEPWFQIENVQNHYFCIRAENCNKYVTLFREGRASYLTLSDEQDLTSTFIISPYTM
ncbi:hypothetical protein NQD34_007298 [Periophthalmus magnuspinnatus]|nr:hypothetical protein NQD34_007298 [Periophthalmus magnuspinnatus]